MKKKPKTLAVDNSYIDSILNDYTTSLKALNRSPKTIEWYLDNLRKYFTFLSDNSMLKHVERLGFHELKAYLLYLQQRDRWPNNNYIKNKGKLSSFSIQGDVRAVKAFWGWMWKEGIIKKNPLDKFPLPKVPQNIIQTISVADMKKLFDAIDKSTPKGERFYCILLMFIDTGIRISELVSIKMLDVNFNSGLVMITGKGQKQRIVPFSSNTRKALMKYVAGSRAKIYSLESDYLFVNEYGDHVSINCLQQAIRRLTKKAGLTKCYPHLFRHTFATMFIAMGGSGLTLKELMGHESLQTTQKYFHPTAKDLKIQHELYSPLKEILNQK